MYILLKIAIHLLISITLYLVFIHQYKNRLSCYFFQEDYENPKGSTR
jgi:hypothetical protein